MVHRQSLFYGFDGRLGRVAFWRAAALNPDDERVRPGGRLAPP